MKKLLFVLFVMSSIVINLIAQAIVEKNDLLNSQDEKQTTRVLPEGMIQIGDSDHWFNPLYAPFDSRGHYSYSQTFYYKSEINSQIDATDKVITKIYYNLAYDVPLPTTQNDWEIYLGHSYVMTGITFVPYSDLQLVYIGLVDWLPVDGWLEIELQTPFYYDNTADLVVAVNERAPGSGSSYFLGTECQAIRIISNHRDTYPFDIPTYNLTTQTLVPGYMNMRFQFEDIKVKVTPRSSDYGFVSVGESVVKPFTIKNNTEQAGEIQAIGLTGYHMGIFNIADVNFEDFPIPLAAGEEFVFHVSCTPTMAGYLSSTLVILAHIDGDYLPVSEIPLTATSVNFTVTELPYSEDFPYGIFPPENWQRFGSVLPIMEKATFIDDGIDVGYWHGLRFLDQLDHEFGGSAHILLSGENRGWLISPRIKLPNLTNISLELDIACFDSLDPTQIDTSGTDDFLAILVSTDGRFSTQNFAAVWTNFPIELLTPFQHVQLYHLNSLSTTGSTQTVNLSPFRNKDVQIALYAGSLLQHSDEVYNHIYVDNFTITGLNAEGDVVDLSRKTMLKSNYPNPFNPETTISFSIGSQKSNEEKVSIDIFNIKGQKVKSLLNEYMTAGEHTVVWNGKDDNGHSVGSGIYFYQLKTLNHASSKKMILLK